LFPVSNDDTATRQLVEKQTEQSSKHTERHTAHQTTYLDELKGALHLHDELPLQKPASGADIHHCTGMCGILQHLFDVAVYLDFAAERAYTAARRPSTSATQRVK
jgi:hypothetical protein